MKNLFFKVTQYVTGSDYSPKNPDINFNIELLKEASLKIESGVYTRIFKRPLVIVLEVGIYTLATILLVMAIYHWNPIDNIFSLAEYATNLNEKINNDNVSITKMGIKITPDPQFKSLYKVYSYSILSIMLLPSLFCFLLGRLFTKSRKRMAVFIEVENNLNTVIKNLS